MKRLFDIIFSGLGLIFLSWLLLVIALLIRIVLGNPVLFKQLRPGLGGKPFFIYKFRTMATVCNSSGELNSDKYRMTKLGSWLRQKSLDELPALWNVLIGNMSIVGPRPLLMEYLGLYTPEQMLRHNMRPGITGWAQVNGRNALSWEEKFKLDVWYIENNNLFFDVKIIFMTFVSVFKSTGINQEGHVTAEKFRGSSE